MVVAGDLYSPFYEVSGKVKWSSTFRAAYQLQFFPGKLCLSRLGKAFYIRCVFDSGQASKHIKLVPKIMDNITCRDGKFSFYMLIDGGTRFVIRDGDQQCLDLFAHYLYDIKNGRTPDETLIPTIKSSVKTPQSRKLLQANDVKPTDVKKSSEPKAAQKVLLPTKKFMNTPTKTCVPKLNSVKTEIPKPVQIAQPLKPSTNSIKSAVSEKLDLEKAETIQDDFNKENRECINYQQSPGKETKVQSNTSTSPVHRDVWLAFGTPHKSPFKELTTQDESSKCARPSQKVHNFYGSSSESSSSIQTAKSKKKPSASRSAIFASPHVSKLASPAVSKIATPTISPFSFLDSKVTAEGFSNLGNSCYMNAILQSFLRLAPFVHELANESILENVDRKSLYFAIYNLYRCRDDHGYSSKKRDALRRVKQSLSTSEMTRRFSGHLQNDAHEFMNICLDQMKEEVKKALGEQYPELEEDDAQMKVCPIIRNFEGCFRKYIRCKGCDDLATKDEVFNHLSLSIPRTSVSPVGYSMENLLERFFQEEDVERRCDKCGCERALQSLEIVSLPRIIIFHLLRNEYHKHLGTQEKKSDKINVHRYFNMSKFCSSYVKGPVSFSPKDVRSPLKVLQDDNETPSNMNHCVSSKSRRCLSMSLGGNSTTASSDKTFDENGLHLLLPDPEMVNVCLNDEEELELARMESIRTKQQEDDVRAKRESLTLFNHASSNSDHVNDVESLEMLGGKEAHSKEHVSIAKDQTDSVCDNDEEMQDSDQNLAVEGKSRGNELDEESTADVHVSADSSVSGKRPPPDTDSFTVGGIKKSLESIANGDGILGTSDVRPKDVQESEDTLETPLKRRKTEEHGIAYQNMKDFPRDNGDDNLKRALELSRNEANYQEMEQSGIREALQRSLEDNRVNAQPLECADKIFEEHLVPVPCRFETREDKPSQMYRLASIVSHVGERTNLGHYISDVLNMKSNQWTRYDDAQAEKVNEHKVRYDKNVDGYIYFYMHRNCADKISKSEDSA